jgi:xanthine dehydrogenase YagS FAD-binding subunit
MKAFTYQRADSAVQAAAAAVKRGAKIIAGGTNLLDLMKLQVETPSNLVDINRLPLDKIEETPDGGLRIGALVRNSDLAADSRVRQRYGVLSRALLAGASAQLRNKATTGGNLLQRERGSADAPHREPDGTCIQLLLTMIQNAEIVVPSATIAVENK